MVMPRMEKPLDRLEWCVGFGHKPFRPVDKPLFEIVVKGKKKITVKVDICERCGLLYWEKGGTK